MVLPDELAKADELTRLLNSRPVLTAADRNSRSEAFRKSFSVDHIGLGRARLTVDAAIAQGRTDLVPESARLMLKEGLTYGQALALRKDITPLPDTNISNGQDHDAHSGVLKRTDQDLGFQCDYVRASFMRHMEAGEPVAPYFVWRIAVLLRKAKEPERELRFLRAWCRHQKGYEALGSRENLLEERLRKLENKLENRR